jgi:predicted dehydrogenase
MKIGLVGCGYFGKIHAKCIKEVKNAHFAGIYDTSSEIAEETAKHFSTTAYSDLNKLIEHCDIVDIVAATSAHFELAKKALIAGKHCFIEKPLTTNVAESEKLIELAQKHNVLVQVGHVERYNPAFLAALPHFTKPFLIKANRLCKFHIRGTDVSVVHDLMIHDIDLVLSMIQSEVIDIQATGCKYVTEFLDIANAKLLFANGSVAHFTASRVADHPVRKMRIFQPENYMTINFQEKKVEKFEFNNQQTIISELPLIEHNSIVEELTDFIHSIKQNKSPKVTMEDGLNALRIADKVVTIILQQNIY